MKEPGKHPLSSDPPRNCGYCVACCIILPIKSSGQGDATKNTLHLPLVKGAGERCRYLKTDLTELPWGCGTYPTRPTRCRDFECYWLSESGQATLRESERPDKLGVMFVVKRLADVFPGKRLTVSHPTEPRQLAEVSPEQPVIMAHETRDRGFTETNAAKRIAYLSCFTLVMLCRKNVESPGFGADLLGPPVLVEAVKHAQVMS